jgi:orotidine-5'-phosphate decarboxylase
MMTLFFLMKSYSERAILHNNPTAKRLLELMDRKKTNLSVAVDVTTKEELIRLAELLGPFICVLKTHIDILEDFDMDLIEKLTLLAQKFDFLIFEDRKFADIGNTVKLQYSKGIYHIADWADLTNAHPIPGDGIVKGLKEVGLPKGRALLILAEMSSAGSLATGIYTLEAIKMAIQHNDFCIGFIGQNRLYEIDGEAIKQDFIYMTPGVGLVAKGDALGQQYRTPHQVIVESGSDVIIVGRGIYVSGDVVQNAKEYRQAGWDAYLQRLKQ